METETPVIRGTRELPRLQSVCFELPTPLVQSGHGWPRPIVPRGFHPFVVSPQGHYIQEECVELMENHHPLLQTGALARGCAPFCCELSQISCQTEAVHAHTSGCMVSQGKANCVMIRSLVLALANALPSTDFLRLPIKSGRPRLDHNASRQAHAPQQARNPQILPRASMSRSVCSGFPTEILMYPSNRALL